MPLLSDTIGGLHFAAIDFESAGAARGETDQPVQIGIAACSRLEDEPELWTSYIAVEKPVLWSASQVHGITTEMLADAPSFPSLWPEIRSRLGQAVVVGHNPATERKFLRGFRATASAVAGYAGPGPDVRSRSGGLFPVFFVRRPRADLFRGSSASCAPVA